MATGPCLPTDDQARMREIALRYRDFVPGIRDDGSVADHDTVTQIMAWQQLEDDLAAAHIVWLKRTRAEFDRRGIPWTTGNLARYDSAGGYP